jgi:hypothetical protein
MSTLISFIQRRNCDGAHGVTRPTLPAALHESTGELDSPCGGAGALS